jgi:hypothetical protein
MAIASFQMEGLGARTYLPEGPFGAAGQTPLPSFKPGAVVAGDCEAEFVYLTFEPTASVTINQGDWFAWDHTYVGVLSPVAAAASLPFGANVGTFFLGGRVGDPAAAPAAGNVWSYTFTAGVYGIWVQRSGTSLMNVATINAQSKAMNTTAVAGQMNQPSAALANSMGIVGAWTAPLTQTFTATTVTGSAILTVVSATKGYAIGMKITGTGIPSSTVIRDIQGSTVTISNAATASGSAVTMTATNSAADVTTTTSSAVLTNVTSINGLYPNQTITGTGISASTTIVSITGNQAPYTITMSAVATATANNIAVVGTIYYEGFLRWPYAGVQN